MLKTAGRRPSFIAACSHSDPDSQASVSYMTLGHHKEKKQAAYRMLPPLLRTHTRGVLGREEMFDTELSQENNVSCCNAARITY